MNELEKCWNYLLESCDVSTQTLEVCTALQGYNIETLEDILYYVTAERTFPFNDDDDDDDDDE